MTSKKHLYAHKELHLDSDKVFINKVLQVPIVLPVRSFAWVQLAGQRDGTSTTGFVSTSPLQATMLPSSQWAKIGLSPSDGYFSDGGTSSFILKNGEGVTFEPNEGIITFQVPGFYTIVYNVIMARISGAAGQDHLFIAAIGGNGNPPNESFGGGTATTLNTHTNSSGTCITEIVNPGETRSLYVYHDHLGGTNAENIDIYAANLLFDKIN